MKKWIATCLALAALVAALLTRVSEAGRSLNHNDTLIRD